MSRNYLVVACLHDLFADLYTGHVFPNKDVADDISKLSPSNLPRPGDWLRRPSDVRELVTVCDATFRRLNHDFEILLPTGETHTVQVPPEYTNIFSCFLISLDGMNINREKLTAMCLVTASTLSTHFTELLYRAASRTAARTLDLEHERERLAGANETILKLQAENAALRDQVAAPAQKPPISTPPQLSFGANGEMFWRNDAGAYHNEDGPALLFKTGSWFWYFNGKLHRPGGKPAVYNCGKYEWFEHGVKIR